MTARIFAADSVQTIGEFEQSALRIATVLAEHGVGKADRVMLKAGNSAGWVGTLLALMHLGASILLVDQREKASTTLVMTTRAKVKLAIVDDDAEIDENERPVRLYELLASAAACRQIAPVLNVDDWCGLPDGLIMWTSGSTGTPKGVVKSGGAFLRNLERNADQVGHHAGDVLMPLLPFPHQYGLSMVLIAWLRRCSLVIAPYTRLDRALRMAGDTKVTVIDATPSIFNSMLNIVERRPRIAHCLSSTRMFCAGAAALDQTLVDRYVDRFGMPLLDSYGSTEYANIAFATITNPVACGRVMDGIAIRVVADDGAPLGPDEVGELQVDTPDIMTGYLSESGEVIEVPRGWSPTGDLGYLDKADNVHVLGRKFAVNRMGYTLYPEIIERKVAAAGCPVRIVAQPDYRLGSRLVFVVEDVELHDADHWRDRLMQVLPEFERPNRVVVLESFPLNRNGKPDKKALERMVAEEVVAVASELDAVGI